MSPSQPILHYLRAGNALKAIEQKHHAALLDHDLWTLSIMDTNPGLMSYYGIFKHLRTYRRKPHYSSIVTSLERLQRNGFVILVPHPTNKFTYYSLTLAGREVLHTLDRILRTGK